MESVATDSAGREHGLRIVHDLGHRGRALDAEACAAYKARLYELTQRRRDARARGDAEADREIDDEADRLQKELNRVRRAGGWDGSARDLARVRVARAIDRALDRISKRLPALGDHLCSRVEKGFDCRYLPDPSWPIEWEL